MSRQPEPIVLEELQNSGDSVGAVIAGIRWEAKAFAEVDAEVADAYMQQADGAFQTALDEVAKKDDPLPLPEELLALCHRDFLPLIGNLAIHQTVGPLEAITMAYDQFVSDMAIQEERAHALIFKKKIDVELEERRGQLAGAFNVMPCIGLLDREIARKGLRDMVAVPAFSSMPELTSNELDLDTIGGRAHIEVFRQFPDEQPHLQYSLYTRSGPQSPHADRLEEGVRIIYTAFDLRSKLQEASYLPLKVIEEMRREGPKLPQITDRLDRRAENLQDAIDGVPMQRRSIFRTFYRQDV